MTAAHSVDILTFRAAIVKTFAAGAIGRPLHGAYHDPLRRLQPSWYTLLRRRERSRNTWRLAVSQHERGVAPFASMTRSHHPVTTLSRGTGLTWRLFRRILREPCMRGPG